MALIWKLSFLSENVSVLPSFLLYPNTIIFFEYCFSFIYFLFLLLFFYRSIVDYNVVLISAIQQSDSVVHIYIYILSKFCFHLAPTV